MDIILGFGLLFYIKNMYLLSENVAYINPQLQNYKISRNFPKLLLI